MYLAHIEPHFLTEAKDMKEVDECPVMNWRMVKKQNVGSGNKWSVLTMEDFEQLKV